MAVLKKRFSVFVAVVPAINKNHQFATFASVRSVYGQWPTTVQLVVNTNSSIIFSDQPTKLHPLSENIV